MNNKKFPTFIDHITNLIKKNTKKRMLFLIFTLILGFFIKTASIRTQEKGHKPLDSGQETGTDLPKSSVKNPDIKDPIPVEEDGSGKNKVFYNAAYGCQFTLPESFSTYESQDIIYARNTESKTQIAVMFIPGDFMDGIQTWEQSTPYIYKIKAYLTDAEGITEEKEAVNYGTALKSDLTIGDFSVKQELGELWFRNSGETQNIKLKECGYFTTYHGNGLALIGSSQTEDSNTVYSYMEHILSSITPYSPTTTHLKMTTYQSDRTSGVKFSYPKNWRISENRDGMISIQAPETQSSPYAGFCIQFYADAQKKYVNDFAQFSAAYETEILKNTFIQEVSDNDFTFTSVVTHMDMDKKLRKKKCIYFEVTDTIYPASSSVRNSMGINKEKIMSKRYAFHTGAAECMLNFIVPGESCDSLINEIIDSLLIP